MSVALHGNNLKLRGTFKNPTRFYSGMYLVKNPMRMGGCCGVMSGQVMGFMNRCGPGHSHEILLRYVSCQKSHEIGWGGDASTGASMTSGATICNAVFVGELLLVSVCVPGELLLISVHSTKT